MTTTQPQDLIEVFDSALIFYYGQRYARENPHKTDAETAQKWFDAGCTVILAALVFGERMAMMHERFLRNINPNDCTNIPALLSIFEENIYSALRREGVGGVIDAWEAAESQWRARINGWKKKKIWLPEMWGPAPGQHGCRVPKRFL